jgi:hypothetical protein
MVTVSYLGRYGFRGFIFVFRFYCVVLLLLQEGKGIESYGKKWRAS